MKRSNKSLLFFWIALGIAVMVTQVSQPVIASTPDVEQAAANEDGADPTTVSISPDFAITSVVGLSLNQEFYKIRDIILDEVADPHVVHVAQKLTETDHFKTLFRKVISANAP